jgi:DNA-binding NarL/FixJ family response regulator
MGATGEFGISTALSPREREVLDYIQLGLTNRQIAERLCISTNTVNKHVQQVLRKLAVSNRVPAALCATRRDEPLRLQALAAMA